MRGAKSSSTFTSLLLSSCSSRSAVQSRNSTVKKGKQKEKGGGGYGSEGGCGGTLSKGEIRGEFQSPLSFELHGKHIKQGRRVLGMWQRYTTA